MQFGFFRCFGYQQPGGMWKRIILGEKNLEPHSNSVNDSKHKQKCDKSSPEGKARTEKFQKVSIWYKSQY